MRAARLLHILLLLQNRGRLSSAVLAAELEVTPRTILRDVDAMTEAGLPVIVHRGSRGGIELGFSYRTRLTGLAADEAEALAVWLASPPPALTALGLAEPAARARVKLVESFPDRVRNVIALAAVRFPLAPPPALPPDPRLPALAQAIREGHTVRLRARSARPVALCPTALALTCHGWELSGPPLAAPVPQSDWGDINISRTPPA